MLESLFSCFKALPMKLLAIAVLYIAHTLDLIILNYRYNYIIVRNNYFLSISCLLMKYIVKTL